mgnify:CR=1
MLASKLGDKVKGIESAKLNMPKIVKVKKLSVADQTPSVFGNMLNSSSKGFQHATPVNPNIGKM